MGIIDELDKLIIEAPEDETEEAQESPDTEEATDEPEAEEETEEPEKETANVGSVGDLLKHVESLQTIVKDIDSKVDIQSEDDPAFRAEIAIRKAIGALQDLSDKLYKKTK